METNSYEDQFAILRAQNEAAERLLRSTETGLNNLFSEIFYTKFKQSEDVTFHFLDQAKVGVIMELPTVKNGVIHTIKESKETADHIRYLTNWSSGAMLPNHEHSDADEVLFCTSGSFKVILETGESFTMNPDEDIKVSAGVKHQVTALERGSLIIDFYKVKSSNVTPAMS